ncbi:response regulator receiver and ANTAR domain protein [Prauserella shujinwangii]|uniref:histidine kinase n=1 Tax=Prauserella shujinwangii TaxID=1453103 RepID=A0A2T0M1B4_9PSEU|nr:ATP-binding protein [Prauserella shujinwangii]PRX50378.1 response regulator receiver and ANTAR domain protein [Prauserella shujinwangii]
MTALNSGDTAWKAETLFAGPGDTLARLRAFDWASSPLGPVERWPAELRAAVRTVLPSRVPMLLWWGPQLTQIFNEAFTPLLGEKYPDAIGQPAAECWAEVWPEVGPLAEQVLRGDGATYSENLRLFMRRHGYLEETYWTFSYSPIHDERGEVAGVFVATTDMTPRVVGDRRLDTLRRLGSLSLAGPTTGGGAAAACTEAIRVLGDNRADLPLVAAYLWGEGDESDGLRLVASAGITEGGGLGGDGLRSVLRRVARGGAAEHVTDLANRLPGSAEVDEALVLPLRPGGQERPAGALLLGLSPYRELDGSYRGFAELVTDRVSTVLADAGVLASEGRRVAALAELDAAKTRFFQNVSHEFRTPLTLLLSPLRELLDEHAGVLPAAQRESMEAAYRAAQRLRRLVDTLLDVARAESAQLRPRPSPTDVAALTADCAAMFHSVAEEAGLELRVHVPATAGGLALLDQDMWARIVFNLLSNAVKFTPAGSVTLTLRVEGDRIVLSVADTGTGIAREQQERIFDRFHQVPEVRSRSREGSGIGLSLVADLVGALGGEVGVDSEPGRGSTFTVTVPLVPAHGPDGGDPSGRATVEDVAPGFVSESRQWEPAAGEDGAGSPARPDRTILLVEDNADMRRYLVRLLREQHWAVEVAADAETALARAETASPDLVLSDVMLPGDDGIALLKDIRSHPRLARVPVVLLTARAGPESAAEGLRHGADDYVVKPFEPGELVGRVRVHLELSAFREELLAAKESEADNLRTALDTRTVISQAIGLVMASRACPAEEAFRHLRELSQERNVKVRQVAQEIIDDFLDELASADLERRER